MGQDEDESVVVAVEVGDGHDALDPRPLVGDLVGDGRDFRSGGSGEDGQEEDEEKRQEREDIPGRPVLRRDIFASFLYSLFPGENQAGGRSG